MRILTLFISLLCSLNVLFAQEDSILISAEELSELSLEMLQSKGAEAFENFEIKTAIVYGEAALARVIQDHGKTDTIYSNALTSLGQYVQLKGDYDRAELLFKEALELNKKIKYNQKWRVARSLEHLGGLYFRVQRMDEALLYFEKARHLMVDLV